MNFCVPRVGFRECSVNTWPLYHTRVPYLVRPHGQSGHVWELAFIIHFVVSSIHLSCMNFPSKPCILFLLCLFCILICIFTLWPVHTQRHSMYSSMHGGSSNFELRYSRLITCCVDFHCYYKRTHSHSWLHRRTFHLG